MTTPAAFPTLLHDWCGQATPVALAVVTAVAGSAPVRLGAMMAVRATGEATGSLSGGCIDAAVHATAVEALSSGRASVAHYGPSGGTVFEVGLTCGGTITVLHKPLSAEDVLTWRAVTSDWLGGQRVAVVCRSSGAGNWLAVWPDRMAGTLAGDGSDGSDGGTLDSLGARLARAVLSGAAGQSSVLDACPGEGPAGEQLLALPLAAPADFVIVGGTAYTAALASAAALLGYCVTVCDPRPTFAQSALYPAARRVICGWPDRVLADLGLDGRSVVCVLSHDVRVDVPALAVALRSPAAYVGAMGSRRTHGDRLQRLVAAGLTGGQLSRLRSPLGLELGALTAEETAVAIVAELIRDLRGGTGRSLSETAGSIHGAAHPGFGPASSTLSFKIASTR